MNGSDGQNHIFEWKQAKTFCLERYGINVYVNMIRHFILVIEGLKDDARKHNDGKRATTHQVLDFVLCDTIEELLEAAELKEGEKCEFTLDEWNNLYKAAAYEIYLKNVGRNEGGVKPGRKKRKRKK